MQLGYFFSFLKTLLTCHYHKHRCFLKVFLLKHSLSKCRVYNAVLVSHFFKYMYIICRTLMLSYIHGDDEEEYILLGDTEKYVPIASEYKVKKLVSELPL